MGTLPLRKFRLPKVPHVPKKGHFPEKGAVLAMGDFAKKREIKLWQIGKKSVRWGLFQTPQNASLLKKKSPKCRRKCCTFWKTPHFWKTVADWEKEPHLGDFHENSLKEIEFAGSPTSLETVADLEKSPTSRENWSTFRENTTNGALLPKRGSFNGNIAF